VFSAFGVASEGQSSAGTESGQAIAHCQFVAPLGATRAPRSVWRARGSAVSLLGQVNAEVQPGRSSVRSLQSSSAPLQTSALGEVPPRHALQIPNSEQVSTPSEHAP
jgi:hypothetical protein